MASDNLKKWITDDISKSEGDQRADFLKSLRDEPERIVRHFATNLHDWAMRAVASGQCLIVDLEKDPSELVEHLKKHFADEISKLPA